MQPMQANSRLSEQLSETIEERIVTGVYPPGCRLDEQELADSFGVSRTPIREALFQLASAGIVDIRPRRGATVPDTTPEQLVEMFEIMAELEALCARLCARRMALEEKAQLMELHDAATEARMGNHTEQYYVLNENLHRCLHEGAHNSFLGEQAKTLYRRLRPYRRLQLQIRKRMYGSCAEHAQLVAAILEGEGDKAADIARQHVLLQGERFTELVTSLRQMHLPLGETGDLT